MKGMNQGSNIEFQLISVGSICVHTPWVRFAQIMNR